MIFKKTIIIVSLIVIVLLSIFLAYKYTQYFLVWQANPRINVDGVKLMMTEEEVKSLLGKEEEYIPGFGGYMLKYPGKGIALHFLDDADTDFFRKVSTIEITNSEYEIYSVSVGDDFDKALASIQKHGFNRQEEGFAGYWKKNMYIIIQNNESKVSSILIGVRDRVSASRIY